MHGWWWPGRQTVVIVPLLVVIVAWWLPQVPWGAAALAVGGVLGIGTWVWTEVEAITIRHTLIVDFMATANPWYRLWRHALPMGRIPTGRDDLLTILWAVLAAAAGYVGWRSAATRDLDDDAGGLRRLAGEQPHDRSGHLVG